MSKSPNAVCFWCNEYHLKTMWCDSFSHTVLEPWKPHRCQGYDGPLVNDASLASLKEVLKDRP